MILISLLKYDYNNIRYENNSKINKSLAKGLRRASTSVEYRVLLVKEDKKKRHISASREARIIPKIALESPVTAIFVYKEFRTLSWKVLGLQSHKSDNTGLKINQIFILHFWPFHFFLAPFPNYLS